MLAPPLPKGRRRASAITRGKGTTMAVLVGSDKVDWLIGTAGADIISALGGNDVLKGGGGADIIDGGSGVDTVVYADSFDYVSVDLATGKGRSGTAQGDVLFNIENVQGSSYSDELFGNNAANELRGLDGDDRLD